MIVIIFCWQSCHYNPIGCSKEQKRLESTSTIVGNSFCVGAGQPFILYRWHERDRTIHKDNMELVARRGLGKD
ncbi:hypothetical protein VNO77_04746 [Canavalia gladiata]|uniref:Uncharacterized protein n=1 Tax=Canavalia gladiata TaxID=3824 RepID=A0AAN9RDI0_CANGL